MSGMFGCRFACAETLLLAALACCSISIGSARADALIGPREYDEDEGDWADRISESVKKTFSGVGKSVGLGPKPEAPPPSESPSGCPSIGVLEGTMSQRVMAAGANGNQGVRYQFSLGNVGRQCSVSGGSVAIKVGADGRVLLGPAGSPGSFTVPIRVVVYSEAQQKPLTSKLYSVPAAVAAGQTGTPFQFVSDNIVVPTTGNASREYSIKVGIDAGKGGGDVAAKKSRRQKRVSSASQ